MKTLSTALLFLLLLAPARPNTNMTSYVGHYLEPFRGPQAYKDVESGLVFYVESDGRHVAAIDGEGKILWHRDPFADAKLSFYRTKTPRVVYLGKAQQWSVEAMKGRGSGKYVGLAFNSSQFGVLDAKNGDFTFMGQD